MSREERPGRPAQRVRVTASRRAATVHRATTRRAALVEQTAVGELYLRGLLRAQLRLALQLVAGMVLGLGGSAVALAVVPGLRRAEVLGLPLPWVVLGVLVYPVLVVAAAVHVRRVEALERSFTYVVTREG